jgi:hypothetical protein
MNESKAAAKNLNRLNTSGMIWGGVNGPNGENDSFFAKD